LLSGAIATGHSILAARAMGADMAYIGSPFIACCEAQADGQYKQMIIDSAAEDILYTDYFTGVHGNYLRGSIRAQGLDPDNLPDRKSGLDYSSGQSKPKSWKQIWGAGQGIGVIENTRPATEFIDQLRTEYHQAVEQLSK